MTIKNPPQNSVIYQAKDGAIELRYDAKQQTILANLNQIADLFGVQKAAISKHLKNIFESNELSRKATVSILETVQTEGNRKVTRLTDVYNLDGIIAVGYRVNSKQATQFRIWATKILTEYVERGYAINQKHIAKNYEKFTKAISDIKILLPENSEINSANILDLVNVFAQTWLSLDAYDKDRLSTKGITKKQISLDSKELEQGISRLKTDLINKGEATEIFAQERTRNNIEGIIGNVMQSFDGLDLYPTLEEKAAHLFYFIVKNHPFIDGNKRSGAFAFVWFLQKHNLLDITKISPQALTAVTLLVAESNPKDKDKMIGFLLALLNGEGKVSYSVKQIQKIVAKKYNIKVSDLRSAERMQPLSFYKHIAAYLARKYTNASFPDIARDFGNKNHATIINSVKKIAQKLSSNDKEICSMVSALEKDILNLA